MEGFLETATRILYLRLGPGTDLIKGIKEGCQQHNVQYGTVTSCLGSLKQTTYTFVRNEPESSSGIAYREPIITHKSNELICAQGTIGLSNNALDVHLHALMCDVEGSLFAGHMLSGCIVCATMEISISTASSGTIIRSVDAAMRLPLFHFSACHA